jgi:predicted nucleotidyltransferase
MSIATDLFSESQARLFRWLFGQPARSFHLSELRRLTNLGSATPQRELKRLNDAGLITSDRVGNLRCFRANEKSPVFNELIALTRKTVGIEAVLREALTPLDSRLYAAWIYGSVAKQTETAGSDVDVMLVGDRLSMEEVLQLILPHEAEIGRKINPTCYTLAEFKQRRAEPDSFVNRVLSQAVLSLRGDVNELARA